MPALAVALGEIARGTFTPPAARRAQMKGDAPTGRAQAPATASIVRELAAAFLAWKEGQGLA